MTAGKVVVSVAVDLGTTYIKTTVATGGGKVELEKNRDGEQMTPSVVDFSGADVVVGSTALANRYFAKEQVVLDSKRFFGEGKVACTDGTGKQRTYEEAFEALLQYSMQDLKTRHGDMLDSVLITVPAHWDSKKREAYKNLCEKHGVNVLVVLSEPTAAAFACERARSGANAPTAGAGVGSNSKQVLVVDIGGGTTDISLVRCTGNSYAVRGTAGIEKLGGTDFSSRIMNHIIETVRASGGNLPDPSANPGFYAELTEKAETAKRTLSMRDMAKIFISTGGQDFTIELRRTEFDQMIYNDVLRVIDAADKLLKAAGSGWDDVETTYLVGGSARIPSLQAQLKQAAGGRLVVPTDPEEVVAKGAAIIALKKYHERPRTVVVSPHDKEILPSPDFDYSEVLTKSLGVVALDPKMGVKRLAPILRAGTKVPVTREETFSLQDQGVKSVEVKIAQGIDHAPEEELTILKKVMFTGLDGGQGVQDRVKIIFDVDTSGIVNGRVIDVETGQEVSVQADYEK